ncbi:hypothetical protein BI372_09395 [Acinetobacter pittii]|nr:hypothetical protein BI372_09395 [Acinetobacter pittii]
MKKVKFENIISLIAISTPIFLGYFYVCGQAFLEGITLNTGFDANFLELEFNQYFYYGFLYSYHYFILIPIAISLIWFTNSFYKSFPKKIYKPPFPSDTKNILTSKLKRIKNQENNLKKRLWFRIRYNNYIFSCFYNWASNSPIKTLVKPFRHGSR